jgi:lycopene cyclase domain-containing protein
MSATYLETSVPFLLWAVGLMTLARWKFGLNLRALVVPILTLLGATAIFDNLIIWSGLVAYDETRILGIRIGHAPIEDFLYTVVAVVLVASLWRILERKDQR